MEPAFHADSIVKHCRGPVAVAGKSQRHEVIISNINLRISGEYSSFILSDLKLLYITYAQSNQNLLSDVKTGDVLPHVILQENCTLSVSWKYFGPIH